MPLYTYRREDGTTFDIRQGFHDEPLTVDPHTGQSVVRVVQPAPIIFKGSGFYVNDSRGKTNSTINSPKKSENGDKPESAPKAEAAPSTTAPTETSATPAPAPVKPAVAD
jgi:predicted nucleic acid-binding Zn ribbon protein